MNVLRERVITKNLILLQNFIVLKEHSSDLDHDLLENQLITYAAKFEEFKTENITLNYVVDFMRQPKYAQLLSQVS